MTVRRVSGTIQPHVVAQAPLEVSTSVELLDAFSRTRAPSAKLAPAAEHVDAVDPASARLIHDAEAHVQAGEMDAAYAAFGAVINDWALPVADRAMAAVKAGLTAYRRRDLNRSEYFQVKAEELQPGRADNLQLAMYLRSLRWDLKEGLEVVEALAKLKPMDVELLRFKSSFLLNDAQPDAALEAAKEGHRLALADEKVSKAEKLRMTVMLGHAYYKAQKPDDAVRVLREALVMEPKDREAHSHIAEIVLPNFADKALRGVVEKKLAEANAAYQAGDYERTQSIALEILEREPNEGLAHKLIVFADDRLQEKKADEKAGEPQILAAVATPGHRQALIAQLEGLAKRAVVKKDGEARAGRVTDLFPDWGMLTEMQRATVAYSVLGYGNMIPDLIGEGLQYRFVLPGTSATAVDPYANATLKKAFGRYSYAGRGWAYHNQHFVVTGVEAIDAAARGKHNTVTHEFAHVVHFYLHECKKRVDKAGVAANEKDRASTKLFDDIERLFEEAKKREHGQTLFDAYSGNNVWEYFAQGMGAYLLESDAPKLFTRNPHLFERVRDIAHRLAAYPAGIPAPDPPPIGQEAAKGSPFVLDRLRQHAQDAFLRARASLLWARVEGIYNPGLAAAAIGSAEERAAAAAVFERAGELGRIDQKLVPRNYLGVAAEAIAGMYGEELLHQVHAELLRLGELGAAGGERAGKDAVARMQALYRELKDHLGEQPGNLRREERVPLAVLERARAELIGVHAKLEA